MGSIPTYSTNSFLQHLFDEGFELAKEKISWYDRDKLCREIEKARSNKNYALADQLRSRLVDNGFVVEIKKDKVDWIIGATFWHKGRALIRYK